MATRSQQTTRHRFISTAVNVLLEQKRKQNEVVAEGAGALRASQNAKSSAELFIPATARSDLTNPFATPGSGMFPDNFDPMAPSG